jgi:hypothetical protein
VGCSRNFLPKENIPYHLQSLILEPIDIALQVEECVFLLLLSNTLKKVGNLKIKFFRTFKMNNWIDEENISKELENLRNINSESMLTDSTLAKRLHDLVQSLSQKQLIEAINISLRIENNFYRQEILNNIFPFIIKEQYAETIEISNKIKGDKAQFKLNLIPHIKSTDIALSFWYSVLHELSLQGRNSILYSLADLSSAIITLSNRSTLKLVVKSVREVCQQWP